MSKFGFASRVRTLSVAALIGATTFMAPTAFAGGGDYDGYDRGHHDSERGDKGQKDYGKHDGAHHEHRGDGQQGEQSIKAGDQYADQSNKAEVEQKQENKNTNISPAIALISDLKQSREVDRKDSGKGSYDKGHHDKSYNGWERHAWSGGGYGHDSDGDKGSRYGDKHGDASTENDQRNENDADTWIGQVNLVEQSQTANQDQGLEHGDEMLDAARFSHGNDGEQSGSQSIKGGDQDATQSNKAGVKQEQENDNWNISPALSLLGDSSTENKQSNDNDADVKVEQGNLAEQSQEATQNQALDLVSGERWGKGGDQDGSQSVKGGDQTVDQSNKAEVEQKQENSNLNISPALSVFGDASTENDQRNENDADAKVEQGNLADQSQTATQDQDLNLVNGLLGKGGEQGGSQSIEGGDQGTDQTNKADVTQKQDNSNINISPAISVFGDASTENDQRNDNEADAKVEQGNAASQTQSAEQTQGGLVGGLLSPVVN